MHLLQGRQTMEYKIKRLKYSNRITMWLGTSENDLISNLIKYHRTIMATISPIIQTVLISIFWIIMCGMLSLIICNGIRYKNMKEEMKFFVYQKNDLVRSVKKLISQTFVSFQIKRSIYKISFLMVPFIF